MKKKLALIFLLLITLIIGCRMPSRMLWSNLKIQIHGGIDFYWVSQTKHPEVYDALLKSSEVDKGKTQKSIEYVILSPKIRKASVKRRELVSGIFGPNEVTINHRYYAVGNHELPVIIDANKMYFPYYHNWDLYANQKDSIYVIEYCY